MSLYRYDANRGPISGNIFTVAIAWAERRAIVRFHMSYKNKCAVYWYCAFLERQTVRGSVSESADPQNGSW